MQTEVMHARLRRRARTLGSGPSPPGLTAERGIETTSNDARLIHRTNEYSHDFPERALRLRQQREAKTVTVRG
jgi:hypothetical protein